MPESNSHNELIPHLFRQEYTKLTAVLCNRFGFQNITIAEDIASETFLKATEYWALNGIPDNPTAWLYTVAKNKSKDYLKHLSTVAKNEQDITAVMALVSEPEAVIDEEIILDSQLRMIFVVCAPSISQTSQICLVLNLLCGFSALEIANALLTNIETVKKRLYRAKEQLRREHFQMEDLSESEILSRLDTVLKAIYLFFNEGYFSQTNDQLVRKDLCAEAIRLALCLTQSSRANIPKVNALLALMCYQSSRLDARVNTVGESVLFEQQDKSMWDKELINKGNYFLVNAFDGDELSKYHLDASIAYWHTTDDEPKKWKNILQLYDQLVVMEPAPIIVLSRLFALSKVHGAEKALGEAELLDFGGSVLYHALLAYLFASLSINENAIAHYKNAIAFSSSSSEIQTFNNAINQLKK